MTLQRISPLTRTDIISRVRRELDDPATLQTGQAIPDAQRNWTDATIAECIDDALINLQHENHIMDPVEAIQQVSLTYASPSTAFPAGVNPTVDYIYKVEDMSDADLPVVVPYVSPLEIERFATDGMPRRYSILGDTPSGTSGHPTAFITLRPNDPITLRITVIRPPVVPGANADAHAYMARWRELIALEAAKALLSVQGSWQDQQEGRLQRSHGIFKALARAIQGPQRIMSTRWR